MKRLTLLVALSTFAMASASSAVTIQFSDHQGAESGSTAFIFQDGLQLQVVANPTDFILTIGEHGLGVACPETMTDCGRNAVEEIDAAWNEAIEIVFVSGETALHGVQVTNLFAGLFAPGDEGDLEAGGIAFHVQGTDFWWDADSGEQWVDFGGVVTDHLLVAATGAGYSNFSLTAIEVGAPGFAEVPGESPTNPMPEPGAALLFLAGAIVVRRKVVLH